MKYREKFGDGTRIFPVIHVTSLEQALRNATLAYEERADGIFLISHGGVTDEGLLEIHARVHAKFPEWWIGVNCLSVAPSHLFLMLNKGVAGVWIDNAEINEEKEEQTKAELIQEARKRSGWEGLYFGGVAFKYQHEVPPEKLGDVAKIASRYMDVVTTSGPSTGSAPAVEKIETMRQALGDFPLAIASGITPGNIDDYLPHSKLRPTGADCFLVSTGISLDDSPDELDRDKLHDLRFKEALAECNRKYGRMLARLAGQNGRNWQQGGRIMGTLSSLTAAEWGADIEVKSKSWNFCGIKVERTQTKMPDNKWGPVRWNVTIGLMRVRTNRRGIFRRSLGCIHLTILSLRSPEVPTMEEVQAWLGMEKAA